MRALLFSIITALALMTSYPVMASGEQHPGDGRLHQDSRSHFDRFHGGSAAVAGKLLDIGVEDDWGTSKKSDSKPKPTTTATTAVASLVASGSDDDLVGGNTSGGDSSAHRGNARDLNHVSRNSNAFMTSLFKRYGKNEDVLSYQGLLRLFAKMGIRTDEVADNHIEVKTNSEAQVKGQVKDQHRRKRSNDAQHGEGHLKLFQKEGACLTPHQILEAYHINPRSGISKEQFRNICPIIIYDIEQSVSLVSTILM